MKTLAILVNGDPPSSVDAAASFERADRLVCCDGAYVVAQSLGREPDLVVGDGDSLSVELKSLLADRWVQIDEQDTNDLDKAFRTALKRFPDADEIVILGAAGLREDHFLGNLFRLPGLFRRASGRDVSMVTNYGCFTICDGMRTYACAPGEAVSVFAPTPGTHAESDGLVWPLNGVALDELWTATLNRTSGESFTLCANHPLIVYRPA